jgi:non-ribosomal peptide synthetase component F
VAEDVFRLCRENEATPYMLLLSVFGVLLYRLTGQDDILVSGPFANRSRAEFDNLVGFFANTLVMRVRLAGNPPFTTLLARARETALAALDHQEVPFEHVVKAVRPQRILGVNPLAQVNFRVRVDPPVTLELSGATTSTVPVDVGFAHFDLALELNVLDDGIVGEFIYNTDLFDRGSIEQLAADFDGLLRQILEQPEVRLLSLELPSEQRTATGNASARGAAIRPIRKTSGSDEAPDRSSAERKRSNRAAGT